MDWSYIYSKWAGENLWRKVSLNVPKMGRNFCGKYSGKVEPIKSFPAEGKVSCEFFPLLHIGPGAIEVGEGGGGELPVLQ